MEEILKTTRQTEATVSDSDTGDSLFLTQSVSSAERKVKRRCLSRKLAQSFSGKSIDESESCKDEEIEKGPDALPLRDSDSGSSEPDLVAIRKAFSLPAPEDKTTSGRRVYRYKHAFPKRIKFPSLKSHSGKLTLSKSQVLVNAEIGGFFKTVKNISEEYKKRRRELSPSLVPAVVDSDDMDKESSDDDGSDIRNVDPASFIVTGKKDKIQLWMTSGVIKKMSLTMKSKEDQEKSSTKQKKQKLSQPSKVAKGLAKGQDASDKSSSLRINVSQLRTKKQEKKNIESAPSSTLSRTDCNVVRNLFADQEEKSEIEAKVLVRSSQSQTIDDCRPNKDGTLSWETLERDSDDETVVQETQWPGLTCQSEEEPQTWGTDGDGELCNESGSFHKRLPGLFEKPDRQTDGAIVSSPLKKRQNNFGTVNKHASKGLLEPLMSKFGISKFVEIRLVNCLAVRADNSITPEKKRKNKIEDKNVNMEPLETMRVVLDFVQDITEKEKAKQKTCDDEKHKHGSKSAGTEELQTTPFSSPKMKTVHPRGSSAVIHEEFGVGSSSSEGLIKNEDCGAYSKRNTSSQDLFEEPDGQTDSTMVFSPLRNSKIANNHEKQLLRRSNTSVWQRTTESIESLKENIGGERQNNNRTVSQHASENLVKSLTSKYGILSREEISLVNSFAPQTNNSITPEKNNKKKQQEQAEGENVNMESCHVEIMEATETPMMNWDSEQEKTEKNRQKKKEKNTSSDKEKHDCGSKSAGSKELQTFSSSKRKMVSTQGSSTIIHVGGSPSEEPVINEDFSVPSKSYTSLHLSEELKDLSDLSSCSSSFKDSAQESTMDYDDSIEENEKNCQSLHSRTLMNNAEYSQRSSECGAPEQSETSTVQQARERKRKKKADVGVALLSVKYPSGSNVSIESSPDKGNLVAVQGQETRMEAVDSPLFNCSGLKFLRRKNRKKAKAMEVCPGQDPAFIHEGHQERFMPSEDVSKPEKRKKDKGKDNEKNDNGCFSEDPADRTVAHLEDPVLVVQHSDARLTEAGGTKGKKKKKKDQQTLTERKSQDEDTQTPCVSTEHLLPIADKPQKHTRTEPSGQQDNGTEIYSKASKDLILSDGSEPIKKKKKRKRHASDDMDPLQCTEVSESRYDAIENMVVERQRKKIITSGPPSEKLTEPLKGSCNIPSSIEFQPVMSQALWAGHLSETQSSENCKVKVKKKDKHKKSSSLTIRAGQDEDTQLACPDNVFSVSITGPGYLTGTDLSSQKDSKTDIHSQESSKDLVLSKGSEPLKKKKAKKKDNPDDKLMFHYAEQSKSSYGRTETNTGESGREKKRKKDKKEETLSESLMMSIAAGPEQLTRTGLFIQQESSTKFHRETSNDVIQSDDDSKPVKKKRIHLFDDAIPSQDAEQSKSGCGNTESSTGEKQGGALQTGRHSASRFTEHCEEKEKKKKKKHKHKESSLTIKASQNEDPQLPSQSFECCLSIAAVHNQLVNSMDVYRMPRKDLKLSAGSELVKKKKTKKQDNADDIASPQDAEQTKSGYSTTKSNTGERRGKEITTVSRPSFENLTEPLTSNWYIPTSREIQPVMGQALQAENKITEHCEEKKKKKKDKNKKSSLTLWTNQNEDTRVPSRSPEGLVFIATPGQLTRIDSSSQQDSSQVSSQDLISSDACESVKKKKKKKKDISDDMVPLCYAEQTKSGCGITESSTRERRGKEIITATRPSFQNLTEPLMSNRYIPSNRGIQPVIGQALQGGQHSEAQSTEDCEVNVKKKKKKKDKHRKSSLSIWTGQNEDTRVPSSSSERLVSIATPGQLTRIDSSSQQDSSQVSSQDLISSDACELVKKKKRKRKKDNSDDMVTSLYAEQTKTGYGTTGTNTGEKQEEMLSEGLVSIADGAGQLMLFSHQDSSTKLHRKDISDVILSDGSEPVKKKKAKKRQLFDDIVTSQEQSKSGCETTESSTGEKQGGALQTGQHSASRFTEHFEEKEKKKKKDKRKKYEEYIWRGQNEDTQVPCPSSECLVSAEPGHLTRTDSSNQQDSTTEVYSQVPSKDLLSSDACELVKKKKKKKKDISDDMVPLCYAEQTKSGCGITESSTRDRRGKEIITATRPSFQNLTEPLMSNRYIPSSREIQPVIGQALQAGQHSEAQSTEDCEVNVKKKKDKHRKSSLSIWTGQNEDTRLPSRSPEGLVSIATLGQLTRIDYSSQQDRSQVSSQDLISSVACELVKKKKKKKKKDNSDDMVPSRYAKQFKTGYGTTGERQGEILSEGLASIADGPGQLMLFSHQDSSTKLHRNDISDVILSGGSELVKKKKTKKQDNADDIASPQDAEQTKSGYSTTKSNTGERRGKEITTVSRPSFENLTEPLTSNWYIPTSREIQPVMGQALQAENKITEHCEEKKKKKKDKNKKSSLTLWTSQNEDTRVPSRSPEGLVSIATPGQLTRIDSSSQQDSSQVSSQDLISSDACESVKKKKKKKKKKDISDDMVPLCYAEQTKSGCGITESSTRDRRGKEIITATRPSFQNLTEPLMSNRYIPSSREIQPVIGQALQAGQHSEAQSTEDCEVKVKKKKKKKDKHRKSSLSIWTGQNEDTRVPSQSPEALVSIATPGQLTRIDSSSQQDRSQVSSQDLISSDACELVKKKKKKKKKDNSDDMVPSLYAEQTKKGYGTTGTNTGEKQEEMLSEGLVSIADGAGQFMKTVLFSHQDSSTKLHRKDISDVILSDGSEPVKKKKAKKRQLFDDIVTSQDAEQSKSGCETTESSTGEKQGGALQICRHSASRFTEHCEEKEKKKHKHKESSLTIKASQNEDPQLPSQSFECCLSIAAVHNQLVNSMDVYRMPRKDLKLSAGSELVKKKKTKKQDNADDIASPQDAEQTKSGYSTTKSNTGERRGKEITTVSRPSFENLTEPLTSNWYIPTSREIQPVMGQALQAENKITEHCEEKKKKKKDKNKKSSLTLWTSQNEDTRVPSRSPEGLVSIATPGQLTRIDSSSQQDSSQVSSQDLISSDACESVKKKKKKKKKDIPDDMVPSLYAEQTKTGYGTTGTNTGEKQEEEMLSEGLVSIADGPGQLMKTVLFSHQDSSTKLHRKDISDVILSDGSELVKKKKAKKRQLSQSKSGCGTTESSTGKRPVEEMITATGPSFENLKVSLKSKWYIH